MAVDNNTPLPGLPLNVSTPVPPTVQMPPPGVRVAANGEVLNSNERPVSPAEAAKLKEAAANGATQDPNEKKTGQAQQPAEPETPSLRNMIGRVRQALQNAQDKAAEKERDANAQYVAQNPESRGLLDPVDGNGKPVHTLGDSGHESSADNQSFAPLHAVQDAMKHVQSGIVEELHAHLPQQEPAPIRDAEVKVVDHSHSENVASTSQDTRITHDAAPATVAAASAHAEFHPLDAVSAAFSHVKEGVVEHLAQHQSPTSEQVAQPIAQADIKVSALESSAPIREASVAEVTHQGASEQVAQPLAQAEIRVSPLESGAPIREALVAEVTHPGQPEQVAQPIAQTDIKVSPLEKGEQVHEVVAELHHGGGPEQVAQPLPQPNIKVSALEAGAAMHEAYGMEPHRPDTPEQVAQPISAPDIKVSTLEAGHAVHAEHGGQTLLHGPLGATQELVDTAAKNMSHSGDSSANRPLEAASVAPSPVAATLHGVHAVDAQGIGTAAQAALDATHPHAVAPVASPQIHVADSNVVSHAALAHSAPVAHHPASVVEHVAESGKPAEVSPTVSQPAPVHHDSTHLAGVDAAAAAAMASAARASAQEKENAVKSSFAASEKPHFSKTGDIEKEASANLGMLVTTATGEKGHSEQQSPQAYAGKVTSFASDHQSRSELQTALEEHWKKAGVPAHEAQTSVAAIAPKLEQHLDKPAHPDAKLAYYAKGDVAVAIEHTGNQSGAHPTSSVSMATLHDVHKHGMPHEAIATVQANLGKEAAGLSKLDLMEKFSPQVVRAIGQEGYPHAEVADTKYHLEAGMRNAGAKSPEVSQADALQALGVVATDSSPKVQAVDRSTGQSYQFTTEQLQQSLGFSNEQSHQAQTAAQAPQQVAQLERGREEYSHH